jgi:hypothetical protein
MTAALRSRMLSSVDQSGIVSARAMRPAVAGFVRILACAAAFTALLGTVARADTQTVDGTLAPIVRINIRQGNVTVRTWDRHVVSVDGDPSLTVVRRSTQQFGRTPLAIPEMSGGLLDPATLPAETFVTAPIPAGPRDVIAIKSVATTPRAPVTVYVPSDAVFVYAHTVSGHIDVTGYHGGTLIAVARNGGVALNDVGGTVFTQTMRGSIVARVSTFDRIRARSLFGNVTFERCFVRQIETTTYGGSIVYDGGSFAPGLARFESTRGNVAIGASGGVQYGAHATADGRVYTNFAGRAQIDARHGETTAVVGEGGPVVTATSQGGSIFLYDGSLRTRGQLPPEWQPAVETLQRPATGLPAPPVGTQRPLELRRHNAFPQTGPFRRFPQHFR